MSLLHILHLSFFFLPLLFCLFRLQSLFLTENTGAIGFLSSHIVLLLRKVSPFLMSSASVALSPRLSTTDLLAFSSLCLLLPPSSSSSARLYFSHLVKLFCLLDQKLNDSRNALVFSPPNHLLLDALTESYYLAIIFGRSKHSSCREYSLTNSIFFTQKRRHISPQLN